MSPDNINNSDEYRWFREWLEPGHTSLEDFTFVVNKIAPAEVLRYELSRRLDSFFAYEKDKAKLWKNFLEVIEQAGSREEFELYMENFIRTLAEQTTSQVKENPEQAKLINVCLAYYTKRSNDETLSTIGEQGRQELKTMASTVVSTMVAPVAGVAGHVISPIAQNVMLTIDKINKAHDVAVAAGLTKKSNQSIGQRIIAGAKNLWNRIKAKASATWSWMKANPAKAALTALVAAGVIAVSVIFFPLTIAAVIVGGALGIARLSYNRYKNHHATLAAMNRVNHFDNIMHQLHDMDPPHKINEDHNHQLSSTAIIDKREGVVPGTRFVEEEHHHDLQQQLARERGIAHLTPVVQKPIEPEQQPSKDSDSKKEEDQHRNERPH